MKWYVNGKTPQRVEGKWVDFSAETPDGYTYFYMKSGTGGDIRISESGDVAIYIVKGRDDVQISGDDVDVG